MKPSSNERQGDKEATIKEMPLTQIFMRTLHNTLLREDYTVYRDPTYDNPGINELTSIRSIKKKGVAISRNSLISFGASGWA